MRHGSLFSGIGGFDLAAQWMGWENSFHCEWNEFGQRVLKYYWPEAISYADITTTDFSIHRGNIDILTGGFPCQPYSVAGKRKGKEDERHLWPEMLRAIREIQPRYVVGENVRGLTNWNGGLVFDEVQSDLEAQGYEVLPFLLPACAVNAPHRRDRIWFVANSISRGRGAFGKSGSVAGLHERRENNSVQTSESNSIYGNATNPQNIGLQFSGNSRNGRSGFENDDSNHASANPNSEQRCEGRLYQERPEEAERHSSTCNTRRIERSTWYNFPTVSPIRSGDDGLSGRLDGITLSKLRTESIKAGGNAIVPQVAYQIFKAIEQYELTF